MSADTISTAYSPTPTPAPADVHTAVDYLEEAIRRQLPPIDLEPVHHFAPGIYARELTIPAGVLLTGKIHRTTHLNIVSQGSIVVWSETEGTRRIDAPFAFVASPGTRRIGFALTDTVWTTIHATDLTDLDELEQVLIEPHSSEYLSEAVLPFDAPFNVLVGGAE